MATKRRPKKRAISTSDEALVAGPASRKTSAAPGLTPLSIRAAAIGVLAEAHM